MIYILLQMSKSSPKVTITFQYMQSNPILVIAQHKILSISYEVKNERK